MFDGKIKYKNFLARKERYINVLLYITLIEEVILFNLKKN